MDAFIIRPFGVKSEIDFDKVETELIIPSLNKAGIAGFTTGDILESGNIRQDMFQSLLTADVVIADISIHNANVYYELGIRHALRDKVTILIRTKKDEVPFDLKTDRYITYDYPQVDKKVDSLAKSIKDSLLSSHHDSPVFLMLPKLKSQNSEIFLSIPQEFAEEVEIAFETKDLGKLALLAQESSNFPWRLPALRLIGNFEFELRALYNAERTWSLVRDIKRNDREANERLATIYQKLAIEVALDETYSSELFTKSNLAIDRLLNNKSNFSPKELAELYALRASNAKIQWENSWKNNEDYDSKALTSKFLMTAYSFYNSAFGEDLNHFYFVANSSSLSSLHAQTKIPLSDKTFGFGPFVSFNRIAYTGFPFANDIFTSSRTHLLKYVVSPTNTIVREVPVIDFDIAWRIVASFSVCHRFNKSLTRKFKL